MNSGGVAQKLADSAARAACITLLCSSCANASFASRHAAIADSNGVGGKRFGFAFLTAPSAHPCAMPEVIPGTNESRKVRLIHKIPGIACESLYEGHIIRAACVAYWKITFAINRKTIRRRLCVGI